jgi:hypothetical protein
MTQDMFLEAQQRSEIVPFEPTQRAALDRFKKFASDMGAHDAGQRDFDFVACNSSAASALSPRLKQRLITEEETFTQTDACHGHCVSKTFVQEVF